MLFNQKSYVIRKKILLRAQKPTPYLAWLYILHTLNSRLKLILMVIIFVKM
jgi:hypothetical protein